MTSAEFKNILLTKGENILINSGNIISEGQLKAIGVKSSADEAREALKEALRAHFSHKMVDIFSVPLESTFECRNNKKIEMISAEDRASLLITVKLFVSCCNAPMVEEAIERSMHELGVESLDNVILKTQGHEAPCKTAMAHAAHDDDTTPSHTCRLLQCYRVLERYVDEGRIAEIGLSDIDNIENLQFILDTVRIKPTVIQLHANVGDTLGLEVVEFAESNNIELLTHSDPEEMMSSVNASSLMASLFWDDEERLQAVTRHHDNLAMTNQENGNGLPSTSFQKPSLPLMVTPSWHFRWLARYACVVRCRGVITSKGYIGHLERDLRHLPPAVDGTINSAI